MRIAGFVVFPLVALALAACSESKSEIKEEPVTRPVLATQVRYEPAVRERSFVVYLETTLDDQLARLARDRKRPLLAAPDRRERLRSLAATRNPLYQEVADLTVPAGHHRNVVALAQKLAADLAQSWQRGPAPEQAA